MISRDFLCEFRQATESTWKNAIVHPDIFGFQFQPGTRWNPGLSAAQIAGYEMALESRFPLDFKTFLEAMNGTDLPTINVYASGGEPHQHSTGVYSYPRDLAVVKERIEMAEERRVEIVAALADQGFDLLGQARLVPIFGHRYVVCEADPERCVVLSVHGTDAIVYGNSLQEYLAAEFLKGIK
jgi:hypothetical protein